MKRTKVQTLDPLETSYLYARMVTLINGLGYVLLWSPASSSIWSEQNIKCLVTFEGIEASQTAMFLNRFVAVNNNFGILQQLTSITME